MTVCSSESADDLIQGLFQVKVLLRLHEKLNDNLNGCQTPGVTEPQQNAYNLIPIYL